MGVSENRGTRKSSDFNSGFPLFSPSIFGYLYFWKHPYKSQTQNTTGLFRRFPPFHGPWPFFDPLGGFTNQGVLLASKKNNIHGPRHWISATNLAAFTFRTATRWRSAREPEPEPDGLAKRNVNGFFLGEKDGKLWISLLSFMVQELPPIFFWG